MSRFKMVNAYNTQRAEDKSETDIFPDLCRNIREDKVIPIIGENFFLDRLLHRKLNISTKPCAR